MSPELKALLASTEATSLRVLVPRKADFLSRLRLIESILSVLFLKYFSSWFDLIGSGDLLKLEFD
jgi:hypothetical protein